MEAKTPQNHSNLPRIDIPGKNDLEILENLKTIIKSNQHDLYKPIPQPEALLSQYYGPLPHTSNHTSHDASPPRTRRPSAFDTPLLHQNTTPSVSASSVGLPFLFAVSLVMCSPSKRFTFSRVNRSRSQ